MKVFARCFVISPRLFIENLKLNYIFLNLLWIMWIKFI